MDAYYHLCLPHSMIKQVMLACHDDVTAGHMGITRTLDQIQKRYHWPRMVKQITNYVRVFRLLDEKNAVS